jgi:hypothetical protein
LPFCLFYKLINYGTIVSTPAFDQTDFEGSPAADVGIFIIERLFTKVVHTLSVIIQEPTTNESLLTVRLKCPPKIPVLQPLEQATLQQPPLISENVDPTELFLPPKILLQLAVTVFS